MNMKCIIQKTISLVAAAALIGCGNKIPPTPLNHANFDSNYTYNIHAIQNTEVANVRGSDIQNLPDRIHITQNNQTKYLLHNQIQSIDGESIQPNGTYALLGFGIGAAAGGTVGVALLISELSSPDKNPDSLCDGDHACNLLAATAAGVILGGIAGLVGLGIGAMIPKKTENSNHPNPLPKQTRSCGCRRECRIQILI
jgi:hypothetical protein